MSPSRPRATIALVVWTLLVWTTRIRNIWGDVTLSDGAKWGRTGLALSFTVLAVVVVAALARDAAWRGTAVLGLAGWTVGVWASRSIGIARGDHAGTFIAVHLGLAVVSAVLAVLAVREAHVHDATSSTRH